MGLLQNVIILQQTLDIRPVWRYVVDKAASD